MKSLFVFTISTLIFSTLSVNAASGNKKKSLEELSHDAYVWGYPAVFMAHVRESMLEKTKESKNSLNHFFHSPKIPDPFLGNFVAVNPENLYGWAWVDLNKEPLVMTHPQMDDRFYSVQLVDAYSNVFQIISNNTQGEKSGIFVITPPGWQGDLPAKTTQLRASTSEILILTQTFVKDTKELQNIANLESQRQLIPLSSWNKGIETDTFKSEYPGEPLKINKNLAASGLKFFQELNQIVTKNPISLKNKVDLDKFSSDPEAKKMLERGLFEGEREIQDRLASGFGTKINGWSYELKSPPFTEDYLLRAAASQRYLFSSPPKESLQMALDVDSEDRQLNSLYFYILHFEKNDFPPARKMWSMRILETKNKTLDDLVRVVSIINDKSTKLKLNEDGSADIYVQSEKPNKANRANWLPLPKDANVYMILTLFNPSNSALNRKYIAPSLIRVDEKDTPKQRITRTMMAVSK